MTARLSLYTDFASAGGTLIGPLDLVDGEVVSRLDGDDRCVWRSSRARWVELGGTLRQVVRVEWPEATVEEFRITRATWDNETPYIQLEALPLFAELVTGGLAIRTVNGLPQTRVVGELALSAWLAQEVIPSRAATRINLTLGTLDRDPVLALDLDITTPGAIIRDLLNKAGLELDLVRNGEVGHILNARLARNSTLPALSVTEGRNLAALAAGVDENNLATVVVPLGDADPDTGNRATMATVRYEVADIAIGNWVLLNDPESGDSPIQVDTQWVGCHLAVVGGVTREILNSRASDGAVQLSDTTAFPIGTRVTIVADASSNPQVEVFDSTAVAARGRRVAPVTFAGVRGEANEIRNGRFASGVTDWSAFNASTPPAYAEVARSELNTELVFAANVPGGRTAGTAGTTPMAVDGLPASARLLRGDVIRQDGTNCVVSNDAVPNTSGAFTSLTVSPGLPAAFSDNAAVKVVRRKTLSFTNVVAMTRFSRYFILSGPSAQELAYLHALNGGIHDVTVTGPNGESYLPGTTPVAPNAANVRFFTFPGDDTKIVMQQNGGWTGGPGESALGFFAMTSVTVISALRLEIARNTSYSAGTITVGDPVTLPFYATGLPAYASGLPMTGVVVSFTSTTITVDVLGLPTGHSLVGASFTSIPNWWPNFPSGPQVPAVNTWQTSFAVSAAFSVVRRKESRNFAFNGSHTSGQTTGISLKAVAALATRNWQSGDVIYAAVDGYAVFVHFTAANPLAGTGTISLGSSNVQNYPLAEVQTATFELLGTFEFDDGVDQWSTSSIFIQLASISGTSVTFTVPDYLVSGSVVTVPQTCNSSVAPYTKTFNVNGAASWTADGSVSVPIAAAASGLAAYTRLWSNWQGSAETARLFLRTAISASATAMVVCGDDAYESDWDGVATPVTTMYRLFGGAGNSYLEFLGNTMIVAATVTANGSGQASVTLTAANTNTVPDNAVLRVSRPIMLRPTDPTNGSVVRLLTAVGSSNQPTGSSNGIQSSSFVVTVPTGGTRTVTALVTFSLSAGTYPLGQQPALAILSSANAVLAWARLSDAGVVVAATPTVARIIAQVTLTTTTTVKLALFGGATDAALWTVAMDAMLAVTTNTEVPFVTSSWANLLAQRGTDILLLRRLLMADLEVDLATLRSWTDAPDSTAPVSVGQTILIPAYGVTRRITSVTRSLVSPDVARLEIGVVSTDLSRRVAKLLAGGS